MKAFRARPLVVASLFLLSGCGGGGGSTPSPAPTPTPTPTPTASAQCSLRARQDWAAAQLREWYLFPETLPVSLDPSPYASVQAYVDALTATARAQGRDRYFTYVESIAQDDAYYDTGEIAGLGLRFGVDPTGRRLLVIEAFEGGPGLAAGIDRGAEIVSIGTRINNLRDVGSIVDSQGLDGVVDALGPDTNGDLRVLRVVDASGTRNVTVTKRAFDLTPVSARYGTRIIEDGGRRYGYVNLRAFISTAEPALRSAFAQFRAQGVTDIVVDLRYNGGGLLSIAELMADLLGRDRSMTDVFAYATFRSEKASENSVSTFTPQPESVAPTRLAFIGTPSTASASEAVINGFIPYMGDRLALIGSNSFGKPVGQIALDNPECDDRLRAVAISLQNSARSGEYFNGLASRVQASCAVDDDISRPMGDAEEAMTRKAIDFLAGRGCSPIAAVSSARSLRVQATDADAPANPAKLLVPDRPDAVQRDVPGLF